MNLKAFEESSKAWVNRLRGSAEGLKWNRKELPVLLQVIQMTRQRRVVVQAGGNLGVFPKYMSGFFETVYTFEPEPELFEIMAQNAPERNIIKFQAALGCERQLVHMSRVRRQQDGGNSHEGITHVSGAGKIPTLQIDDLGLPICDLVYLDIEGYEFYALKGAVKTVERCQPLIAVEVNKSLKQMGGITREDIHAWFRIHEYDFLQKIRSDEIFTPRSWGSVQERD